MYLFVSCIYNFVFKIYTRHVMLHTECVSARMCVWLRLQRDKRYIGNNLVRIFRNPKANCKAF